MKNPLFPNEPLSTHMRATYFALRKGMTVMALVFPFVLWWGGLALGITLQDSMSDYYFAARPGEVDAFPLRTWFVGLLFAIGAFLWLYKGYDDEENLVLNVAGLCAWLVALFPTDREGQAPEVPGFSLSELSVHGTSAVLLFVCLAWVAWRCADNTLKLLPAKHQDLAPLFRHLYRGCAVLMVVLPVSAFALGVVGGLKQYVYFAEAFGIVVFAAYWWIKHRELLLSHADDQALVGALDEVMPTGRSAPAATAAAPASTPAPGSASGMAPWGRLFGVLLRPVLQR